MHKTMRKSAVLKGAVAGIASIAMLMSVSVTANARGHSLVRQRGQAEHHLAARRVLQMVDPEEGREQHAAGRCLPRQGHRCRQERARTERQDRRGHQQQGRRRHHQGRRHLHAGRARRSRRERRRRTAHLQGRVRADHRPVRGRGRRAGRAAQDLRPGVQQKQQGLVRGLRRHRQRQEGLQLPASVLQQGERRRRPHDRR